MSGFLFFVAFMQILNDFYGIIFSFPSERAIFLKEIGSKYYTVPSYFFGRIFVEMPVTIVIVMVT